MKRKIGAIAASLGTTVRTLRFYEEQGLVQPQRTPGGTRLYSAEDEARFAALLALSRAGVALQTLAELAGTRAESASGDEASARVGARLDAMLAELDAKAESIARQQADLRQAKHWVQRCRGCPKAPTRAVCDTCDRAKGWNDIGVMRVVWDAPPDV